MLNIPRCFDLSGIVTDEDGLPIRGAEIWLARHSILVDGTLVAMTDFDGRFLLRSVPCDSTPALAASADGYRPSRVAGVGGDEGDEIPVSFVLYRGSGSVTGTVVDALTGAPVPGALIGIGPRECMEFSEIGIGAELAQWARLARADASGRFHANGVAPGRCSIAARAPGHSLWREEIELKEGTTEYVQARLLPEAILEGHVLDDQGIPIAGASVVAGRGVEWLRAADRTSGDGYFHIGSLEAPATLDVRVYGRQGCIATTSFMAVPGKTHVWEARPSRTESIGGQLLDEANNPLSGWELQLQHSTGTRCTSTVGDGGFNFEDLPAGEYRLLAFDPGCMDEYKSCFPSIECVGLEPGLEALIVHVPCDRMASVFIVGIFVDEAGLPIPDSEVLPSCSKGNTLRLGCDGSGHFALGPFPPGEWRVQLVAPSRSLIDLGLRSLERGETWDCGEVRLVPEGRLTVRLHPEGFDPNEGLRVRIRQGDVFRHEVLTSAELLTRSCILPPGSYGISICGGPYDCLELSCEISSGEETVIDMPVRRGYRCIVRVLTDERLGEIELRVKLLNNQAASSIHREYGSAKSGVLDFSFYLSPGEYAVEALAGLRQASAGFHVVEEDCTDPMIVLDLR